MSTDQTANIRYTNIQVSVEMEQLDEGWRYKEQALYLGLSILFRDAKCPTLARHYLDMYENLYQGNTYIHKY